MKTVFYILWLLTVILDMSSGPPRAWAVGLLIFAGYLPMGAQMLFAHDE